MARFKYIMYGYDMMVSRAVRRNIFLSKFNPTVFITWSMFLIAPTKNFSTKLVHLTPLRATPFFGLFYTGEILKNAFLLYT